MSWFSPGCFTAGGPGSPDLLAEFLLLLLQVLQTLSDRRAAQLQVEDNRGRLLGDILILSKLKLGQTTGWTRTSQLLVCHHMLKLKGQDSVLLLVSVIQQFTHQMILDVRWC